MTVQIRKLTGPDAAIFHQCRSAGVAESAEAFLVTVQDLQQMPLTKIEAELNSADMHHLGAFIDDELVGFMRFARLERVARRHVAEVRSVYVKSGLRGKGVARQLLRQLIADARSAGLEALTLTVLATNKPARQLYQSLGFQLYGLEPNAIKRDQRYQDLALYRLALSL